MLDYLERNYLCSMKHFLWLNIFVVVACGGSPEQVSVQERDITVAVYASATVKAENQFTLFSKMPGHVASVVAEAGQVLDAGDTILLMHAPNTTLQEERALQAEAFSRKMGGKESPEYRDLMQSLELAKKRYRQDSLLWMRQERLAKQGIGSAVEREQRELAKAASLADVRRLELAVQRFLSTGSFQEAMDRNLRMQAGKNVNDYILRVQQSFRVFDIFVKPGDYIGPQTPVAVLGDSSRFYLELQLDERDIGRVFEEMEIQVLLESYPGQAFEARLRKIRPLMRPGTRTFAAEADFMDLPARLYPELSAEANLIVQRIPNALVIPIQYLRPDSTVCLGKDNIQRVTPGNRDDSWVEIKDGLQKGQVIYLCP
jgi:HlyD family secretion protein